MIFPFVQEMQQAVPDTSGSTAYDSIWAQTQAPAGLETVFLAQDKLYVVLVVVLLIWFGIVFFLFRTDRKLDRLERSIAEDIHGSDADR